MNLAGVALFGTAIAWTFVTGTRGDPWPVVATLAASGIVLIGARAATRRSRLVVPAAVVAVGIAVAVGTRADLLSARPLSGPFGYVNAKGAFFMVVSIAGLMLAVGASNLALRAIGVAAAIGAAVIPAVSHVAGATILVVAIPVPAALLASRGDRSARLAVTLCGSLFLVAVIGTFALGTRSWSHSTSATETRIRDVLTGNRLELWHEAEQIIAREPLWGIGPGRFGSVAPLSQRDPSNLLFWAQHDFLQQGAEQGVLGGILLLALFVWGFVALGSRSQVDVFVVLAAAALAAVGIQACEDYILHFPAVALATAALVGAGIAPATDGPSNGSRNA